MHIVRRLLLTAALAASATFIVPAGPASATIRECHEFTISGRTIVHCFPPLEINLKGPEWCPVCLPTFGLWDSIDPKFRAGYTDGLSRGLQLLDQAAATQDPSEIKKLHGLAADSFRASAKVLGNSVVKLDSIGWFDPKNVKFYVDWKQPQALKAAGEYMVNGLGLMHKALGDPDPEPNIAAAMTQFDQAYKALASL